jgi:hypothetical protein
MDKVPPQSAEGERGFLGDTHASRTTRAAIPAGPVLKGAGQGGGVFPLLRTLQQTESNACRSGGRAVGVPLFQLSGVCSGAQRAVALVHVWYRSLATAPEKGQGRWRELLLGDDPHEEQMRRADRAEGNAAKARRMRHEGARPGRREGRPLQAGPGEEGHFPQFYDAL